MLHRDRMRVSHLKRTHESATRILVMKAIERPKSVDEGARAKEAYYREIDLVDSEIFMEIAEKDKKAEKIRQEIDTKYKNLDNFFAQNGIEDLHKDPKKLLTDVACRY